VKINGGTLKIASSQTLNNPIVVAAGGGTLTGPGTVNGTVALNTGLTLESPTNDTLSIRGIISGTGGLTKTGAGSVTLSGANTYTGGTIINGGILTLSADSALGSTSAAVTVNNGGTLALNNVTTSLTPTLNSGSKLIGKGTLNNAIIGSNVTLSPGTTTDRIGTLNFTDLTLGQGGILEIHVRYDGEGFLFDQINVSSTETLTISANAANPLTLKLISLNSDSLPGQLDGTSLGTTRTLNSLISTNGISGSLTLGSNLIIDSQNFTTGSPGATFGFTKDGNNFNLSFTPTAAIPEPSTYALLALGLGALVLQIRRRRA
jgi:fibronectin-binding autotransporter adhesin